MFTGIVEELGTLRSFQAGRMVIAAKSVLEGTAIGDSIAVNGICLTVTSMDSSSFSADVMPETLRRTSLEGMGAGTPLNLERALTLSSRLGGHIVSGHIDGTGTITGFTDEGNASVMTVKAGAALLRYIIPKGSVCLDGISLTVVDVAADRFSVSLIPHTRAITNLAVRKEGDAINIETDVVAKYIERFVTQPRETSKTSAVTMDFLRKNGF
ncbi:riboflavin synthase [Selenomonas sp. TAMA-11512]|uniref:riboflavin synthase n=1 Tax=Selenomonas sp. TAMA-11512 TaxID=3095337 RepID=UPI00308C2D09|nr:riboflavin synthase [Selenomonas sp. TAMA-11512]